MLTVTIDAPGLSRPLCVPRCPKCGFSMNVHFSQQPIGEQRMVAVFGHCVRCMHVEHITTQEVNLEPVPESVQSDPGAESADGSVPRRSAAG